MIFQRIAGFVRRKQEEAVRNYLNALPGLVLCEGGQLPNRLPLNIGNLQQLPAERVPFGTSFREVPGSHLSPCRLVELHEGCRIELRRDSWDTVFTETYLKGGPRLPLRGSYIPEELRATASETVSDMDLAAFGIEVWSGNYAHWVVYHLPKMLAFIENGWGENILLPERGHLTEIEGRDQGFLRLLDGAVTNWPMLKAGSTHVAKLALIDGDPHHGSLLRRVADRVKSGAAVGTGGGRRILISRQDAVRRRLVNEAELAEELEAYGFEAVALERLSLVEQINLFANAEVVLAMHGAGLANMTFCPKDTTIIEIVPRDFPCPDFYRLALSLGLPYAMMMANSVGAGQPGQRDMIVSISELVDLVRTVGM